MTEAECMVEHDPMCVWSRREDPQPEQPCGNCQLIARVRDDEREKIAEAIEAEHQPFDEWCCFNEIIHSTLFKAATIARGGGPMGEQRCALCLGRMDEDNYERSAYVPYPMHADKGICARRIREQERTRMVDEGWTPPDFSLFPGRSVKSASANVEPSAAVYARAWDEVQEEVMKKVRDCEHMIAAAVREERERIAAGIKAMPSELIRRDDAIVLARRGGSDG